MKKTIFLFVFLLIGVVITWGFIWLPDDIIYKEKGTENTYTNFFNVWGYIAITCSFTLSLYALHHIAVKVYDYIRK
jgi:hypothetical protein